MHDEWRSGREEVLVRWRTSTTEMLPMTFSALSTTATDESPSLFMSRSASVNGLSPLWYVSICATMTFFSICQDLLDGNDLPGADIEIFQDLRVKMIYDGK